MKSMFRGMMPWWGWAFILGVLAFLVVEAYGQALDGVNLRAWGFTTIGPSGDLFLASCDDTGRITSCDGSPGWCAEARIKCEKEATVWGPIIPVDGYFIDCGPRDCKDFRQIGFRSDGVVVWRKP